LAKIEEKVESLIEPKVQELGYNLYDVEYVKEGKEYYLRIYIDKDTGISLEDCELVSNNINELLDQADYIKEQYFLEVSSPGIERILKKDKHLKDNIGAKVQIKLFKPVNGKKQYEGILKNFNESNIEIETASATLEIERQNIGQIKTIFEWE
jgi:ribosome maturation factor RimP